MRGKSKNRLKKELEINLVSIYDMKIEKEVSIAYKPPQGETCQIILGTTLNDLKSGEKIHLFQALTKPEASFVSKRGGQDIAYPWIILTN